MSRRARGLLLAASALLVLVLSSCAGALQKDSRELAPLEPGGQVVELSGVQGKYPEVVSASLYFYPGKFEVPVKPFGGGLWRADLSAAQVSGMARERYGFRVFRCRLTVVTRGLAGETDSHTQDLTIDLEPG